MTTVKDTFAAISHADEDLLLPLASSSTLPVRQSLPVLRTNRLETWQALTLTHRSSSRRAQWMAEEQRQPHTTQGMAGQLQHRSAVHKNTQQHNSSCSVPWQPAFPRSNCLLQWYCDMLPDVLLVQASDTAIAM